MNSAMDTLKKTRLRDRTDRAWFSRLLRHLARKRSGSILITLEATWGTQTQVHEMKVDLP